MSQYQISCQPDKLNLVSAKIIAILKSVLNKEVSLVKARMNDCLDNNDMEQFKLLSIEYKSMLKRSEKALNEKYQDVLVRLNTWSSQKGVVSKKQSLERVERKATIKSNVDAVTQMSANDIMESVYDENGCVIINIDCMRFNRLLDEVVRFEESKKSDQPNFIDSNEFIAQQIGKNDGLFTCLRASERCLFLDTPTYQTVAEVTSNRIHGLSGSTKCVVIPGLANECGTCIGIPLSQEFMTNTPPEFKTLGLLPKFANLRIALRKTTKEAHSSRDKNIDESSTVLGAGFSMIFLEALEMFTKDLTSPPEENSNVMMIIRGLLGFILTTMASGVNGQMMGWDIFGDGSSVPTTIESWKVYQRIMLQARLAGWITPELMKKYRKVTSRAVAMFN
jgi:hypothetical protein